MMQNREIRIYAKVVADLFHPGHVRFLKAARELGTHLTVCVVPDDRVATFKGKRPILSHEQRMEVVSACRWVDQVIGDGPREISLDFMAKNRFDIYAFGASSQEELVKKLADCVELPEKMKVILPYSPEISSTLIRQRIEE